jgi:predicted aldo/keto reductase-like oxidoreductase
MRFSDPVTLGKTGLRVGRLGISSSYGAPAKSYEEACERGCNYVNWGTFIKGRSGAMKEAIRNIVRNGKRDQLVIGLLAYSHSALLTDFFLGRGLKALGTDHIDVLLLGYFPDRPPQRVIDGALALKQKGMIRYLGVTSHHRTVFPKLHQEGLFDVFHLRYNAAHRGAETEVFPHLDAQNREGVVSFTATRWGRLLNPKKMPPGESPPTAVDCYRFVLSHPSVDVCMMGAKNANQMRENLGLLDTDPMTEEELARMRRIGDHVYGKKS